MPEETTSAADLAEFYDAHRDDKEMWDEPEPVAKSERLDVTLSVRFTRSEIARIREAAESANVKPTTLIREAALNHVLPVDVKRLSADLDRLAELVSDARHSLRSS